MSKCQWCHPVSPPKMKLSLLLLPKRKPARFHLFTPETILALDSPLIMNPNKSQPSQTTSTSQESVRSLLTKTMSKH